MNQLWGPALDAELEYRRERAAQTYGTPTALTRLRAWGAARRATRSRSLAARARDAVERFAGTIEEVASRTDVERETTVVRRAAEIEAGLEGVRPHEARPRHAA